MNRMESVKGLMADTSRRIEVTFTNLCPLCGKKEISNELMSQSPFAAMIPRNTHSICDDCQRIKARNDAEIAEKERIANIITATNVPLAFRNWDSNIGNNALAARIKSNRGQHLMISGRNGIGKTRAAAINLLQLALQQGYRCKFLRFCDMLEQYAIIRKREFEESGNYIRQLGNIDYLLIDDIAKVRITEAGGELLFSLVDGIYAGIFNSKLWLTGNFTLADLGKAFEVRNVGDAVVRRIDEMIRESQMVKIEAR